MYDAMSSDAVPQSSGAAGGWASAQKCGTTKSWLKRESFDSEYVRRLTNGDAETERHFAGYFGNYY